VRQAFHEAVADRIGHLHEDDRNTPAQFARVEAGKLNA